MIETRVHEKIFEEYPSFRRGIVLARNIDNKGYSERLETLLHEAIQEASGNPVDIKADPRTSIWNDAYRLFGSNPNKFPPAHCALLKRVQKTGASIPFINKIVAIMNENSIRGITPVGGDDVNRAGQCLELRYADGVESFTPLGRPDVQEHPNPGEIIYVVAESGEVMCRRWNWRNGHKTLISEETSTMVMNIDVLGDDSETRAVKIRDRVASMIEDFCGAETEIALLSPGKTSKQF